MELKHTIEILTKDIQDIEKLVGNLQIYQDGSAIELDLALSKMRNVYEILTMIKADRLDELIHPESEGIPEPAQEPVPEPEPEPIPEPEPEPEPASPTKKSRDARIIADKFATESSINENMAGQRETHMESKLIGQPIDSIIRNIGINDRFLIIRELFSGDSEEFSKMVSNLDGAENYQVAIGILNSQFADNSDHDGVGILAGLVKRKFLRA